MKNGSVSCKIWMIIMLPLLSYSTIANELVGYWKGDLIVSSHTIPLIINIEAKNNHYSVSLDSPSQNTFNQPAALLGSSLDQEVIISFPSINAKFIGKLTEKKLVGQFFQMAKNFDIVFF